MVKSILLSGFGAYFGFWGTWSMARAGTHYEHAFECYLQTQNIPYIAVDQSQKAVFAGAKLKSFDFILYPSRRPRILVDVKGRKVSSRSFFRGGGIESWTTRDDVTGLQAWEEIFGNEYLAAFVFAYWLTEPPPKPYPNSARSAPVSLQPGLFDDIFHYQERKYAFWGVELSGYRLRMKQRSPKWNTVYVPRKSFRQTARPFLEFALGS